VTLQDSFLVSEIRKMIVSEEKTDSLFAKGLGYFELLIDSKIRNGLRLPDNTRIDTVLTYKIFTTFLHPEKDRNPLNGDLYPSYFSIVDSRIISIGLADENILNHFGYSDRSKLVYLKLLEPYLSRSESFNSDVIKLKAPWVIHFLENRFKSQKVDTIVIKPSNR